MNRESNEIRVFANEMKEVFQSVLTRSGLNNEKALVCADIFTANSVDGVYTHGVNRFPRFVEYIKKGCVSKDAEPSLEHKVNGLEQWNGNLGPGILNAMHATGTVMQLATQFGIGCVALSNTNHWMRGGTYGWQAAKAGYVFIGWTNTIANMPAWGAADARLGNNPLVIAIPYQDEAIVLDMAMSQYSFGAMELSVLKNETLPVLGGFDSKGQLTNDPSAIIHSGRPLPIGYWKGAGLSLLLDLLATILSGGLSTHEISKREVEHGLSQVFIAIDISKLRHSSAIPQMIGNIIDDYKKSVPAGEEDKITWPGERVLQTRKRNMEQGIPVMEKIWQHVLSL
ncbi:MAG TPA: 3-dehydro-L-gulonate 2-dehydrogenase [Chitinophagaceae bacterium]